MLGKARPYPSAIPWLAAGALALTLGCSSAADEELPLAMPDSTKVSPSGAAYPEDFLGTRKRVGTTRGDRIANLAFRGYRGGTPGELVTLSLADYYEPDANEPRALYIFAAASWCAICARVASQLEQRAAELEQQGARILVLLVNGESQGTGPSLTELDRWAARHPMGLDLGVDVRATTLGAYGLQGVPFNLLIDPRSMEILDAQVGEATVERYVGAGLKFTADNPPSYP